MFCIVLHLKKNTQVKIYFVFHDQSEGNNEELEEMSNYRNYKQVFTYITC